MWKGDNAMWYKRIYETKKTYLKKGKVNLLYGPRRVGKTAIIKEILNKKNKKIFSGDGDDIQLRKILSSNDSNKILSVFQDYDYIFIDEAQRITDIGWGLKILIDNLPKTTIIASGSSSFQLSSQVGAPLTGRSITSMLFPISLLELKKQFGGMHIFQQLENHIIYGMYPEVLSTKNNKNKISYLLELRNSYLLKDIFELENIRNSDKIYDLLQLIAFQIGNEVSLNELSNSLGIAKQTIAHYLDLLEKAFIIKKVNGFSRNLRKEVTKTSRYYFFDNGIRNAVINNFNPIKQRDDIGMLWENFAIMERFKKQHYHNIYSNNYFWRTYDQKEVDLVEERDGKLFGYEFKWNPKKIKIQQVWLDTYNNASFDIINKDNILEFVT
ncbi:MAG: ATP-binding protein [Bacteroidota bacterium]|nr:ATP-binding protein [Bacteroidota bacterium]